MSEFRSRTFWMLGIMVAAFICFTILVFHLQRAKKVEQENSLSLYNSEGDTILDLTHESKNVKIWIEKNGKPDVWIELNKGGWTRK